MRAAKWLDRRISAPGPYLTLCTTPEQFAAAMKHLKAPAQPSFLKTKHSNATTHYFDGPTGGLCAVVCIGSTDGTKPIEIAGLLVHEAVHVWQAYAEWIGETHPGDEQEAYAVQSIAQELMMAFAARSLKPARQSSPRRPRAFQR